MFVCLGYTRLIQASTLPSVNGKNNYANNTLERIQNELQSQRYAENAAF